jgi:hypothetical protein
MQSIDTHACAGIPVEAKLHPLVNSGIDGGAANVGTRIFEMTPLKQQVRLLISSPQKLLRLAHWEF